MKRDFFTVYAGFRFFEETKRVSFTAAEKELLGRHQKFYGEAVFEKSHVLLHAESLICPHCQHKIPAYTPFLSAHYFYKKTEKAKILEFLNPQVSIAEVQKARTLHLQTLKKENIDKTITCPHCFYKGVLSEEKSQSFIEEKKQRITVGLGLSLQALLNCKWIPKKFSVPLQNVFETVTFNLKNGHVFLRLETENGKPIYTLDITNIKNAKVFEDELLELLSWNHRVLHRLKAFFKSHGIKIPFPNDALDAEHFLLLTRFQNYPESFYDSLPFLKGTNYLTPSLKGMGKALQKAEYVPHILEKSNLPQCKSVRKILFLSPWLLFFIPQMESLWSIFSDVNYFCRCLSSAQVYRHLCDLLDYPDTEKFYRLYAEKKGRDGLLKCMEQAVGFTLYDVPFLMKRKELQQEEMQKWNTKYIVTMSESFFWPQWYLSCRYQRPKSADDTVSIPKFSNNGYVFKSLKHKKDYVTASKDLHNCLKEYIGEGKTVVGVRKKNHYVGAIELRGKKVIQSLMVDNMPMQEDAALYAAFQAFAKKFGLREVQYT